MDQMPAGMGFFWVFAVVWWGAGLVALIVLLVALWRGMRAQEGMARSLTAIERLLAERPRP